MILNKLLFQTDAVIALTFWILLAMSFLSWAVIFHKVAQYKNISKNIIRKNIEGYCLESGNDKNLFLFKERLESGLVILATIGSSAPFVGLFGTVWGIYFSLIDISSAGSASIEVVAKPMGEALIATAFGLFAAIPAVIAYNICRVKGKSLYRRFSFLLDK